MSKAPAKKAKAPPRLKMLGVRVNDAEHKKFTRIAKPQGGTAAVLRSFVNNLIALNK